ncbi:TraB/GumN family protein [Paracoccus albus]|uniref:TraB/GumN family protein n=1 Tax=Paracoccus albus TaxID=3017784 RepID=UPI0022F09621|nr:TraB/GumN family protein [Paracoccus albus]WBU59164.1 TraB/GumN family protein [Paracoccus albus]
MKAIIASCALSLFAGAGFAQECVGDNLIDALPEHDRAWIDAQSQAVPNHQGILWQASKGDERISIVGTYHFDHPMHRATVEKLRPQLEAADRLLVEMGPEEEAEMLSAMSSDPTLIMEPSGPTLPERLSEEHWQQVGDAMADRGVPAIMASRMKPWYIATLLAISPCAMKQMAGNGGKPRGLDWQLMQVAQDAGVPVEALEPWDTFVRIFSGLTPKEEIDMIVYSLPVASYADDYTATMEAAYAEGDIWQIWEFGRLDAYNNSGLSREEVDALTAEAKEVLIDERNRNWIAPLTQAAEEAAAKDKSIVAAFGALHLPGEQGVLRLLEDDGWQIERLD